MVREDGFMIHGKTFPCIVDYHSKFLIVKKVNGLPADDLVQVAKLIFAEYRLPKKIVLDVDANIPSLLQEMNIQQIISSSYHHQSNSQVEACIKFLKHTIKNALALVKTYM